MSDVLPPLLPCRLIIIGSVVAPLDINARHAMIYITGDDRDLGQAGVSVIRENCLHAHWDRLEQHDLTYIGI
jgi:hypothetical protein